MLNLAESLVASRAFPTVVFGSVMGRVARDPQGPAFALPLTDPGASDRGAAPRFA
jgi:hypothetical protein